VPRRPSVRYFPSRGCYYCQVNGKQHRLATGPDDAPHGPTYLAAFEAFNQLLQSAGDTSPTKYEVSQEEFVRVWQDAQSVDEVCERLKMRYGIVLARVSNYRRRGVRLKKMPRKNSRRVDVDKLNRLIEETAKKDGDGLKSRPPTITLTREDIPELVAKILRQLGYLK
jgi:hypothetical protein